MIAIDTNILVDHLRGHAPGVKFLRTTKEEILFSAITETELLAGKANNDPKQREALLQLLGQWKKIDVTNPVAKLAGDLCREYTIEVPDGIIAATAILNRAELITRNIKHFRHIKELQVRSPY
jgi:hypothetical protein